MEEIDMAEISDDSASIIVNDDEIIIEENDQTDSSSKQNDSIVAASINIIEPVPLRYVPPHLKKPSADICIPNSSATADSQSRLQRQIQGQLNRLSDSTVNSVATHLEALYVNNPRHTITDMITRLLLGYIGSASNIHDTFICTYACFIACLHNSVNDFGAHFVQILISKLDYVSENAQMGESKCSLNYTSLISYLYNFNQMGHILIYDLIRKLLDNLNESNVESLLKILKISGGKLRSDDPSSLKEIIIMVSERNIKDLSYFQTNERLRSKFMVETIMDLKNNKKESVSNPIQLERLRKTVCSYLSSKGKSSAEPLGFSLSDLLSSNGKWWKTGNAWKGPADIPLAVLKNNTKLEKLAINLKMNTDSRKLVFYTLMSSTDYKHAVTLLLKLNLKGTPQRDLIRVPLYCLVHESSYNPFYTYVLSELLKSRTNQVSFQYAVWDHFKTMNSAQTLNLSQCITNLIIDGKVTLDILKSLDFIKLSSEEEKLVGAIVVKLVKDGKEGVFEMGNEDVKSGLSFFGRRLGKVGLTLAKILEKLRES
jgi:nucleolar MIF4G domain-containing protein 1